VIFKIITLALAGILAIALPTARPPAKSTPNVLTQHNLIYSSEIGAWDTSGGPAVTSKRIVSQVTAARIAMIRYGVYDCFTSERCGRDHQ
jgi:hypothetical protein